LLDDLQPQGERERVLAEHIFGLFWRLRRAAIAEAGVLLHRVREVKGLGPKPYAKIIPTRHLPDDSGPETASEDDPNPGQPWAETQSWVEAPPQPNIVDIGQAHILDVQKGDALSRIRRHETSVENSLFRALRELERLQEKRLASMLPACSEDADSLVPEGAHDSDSDGKAA
jgi:hypothetical protein